MVIIWHILSQKSTAEEIIGHFEGQHADLVICDGAPDGKNVHLSFLKCLLFVTLFALMFRSLVSFEKC